MVVGGAGYGLLFSLPPPGRARCPTGTYPHHKVEGEWLVGWHLEWCCCCYTTFVSPPPASRYRCSAETSTPPGQGEESLATHPLGLGSSHTRLHPQGVRNEPSHCLSCYYWLCLSVVTSVIGKSALVEAVLLLGSCWGICCLFCLEGDFQLGSYNL